MKRPLLLTVATLVLVACPPPKTPNPPPAGAFYFPTGIAHQASAESADGFLYVSNSNFDKRFDFGSVVAVDLSVVGGSNGGLPAFGAPASPSGPKQIAELNTTESNLAYVQSFGGELGKLPLGSGSARLFLPARSEGDKLYTLDVSGSTVRCVPDLGSNNCVEGAPSLNGFARSPVDGGTPETSLPRARQPIGVGVSADGAVFVTHLQFAGDSHAPHYYVANFDGNQPSLSSDSFVEIGPSPGNSVAVGSRYAFISGRATSSLANLVRLIDRTNHQLLEPRLQNAFSVLETRGIALSGDQSRLYLAGRSPDTLLVIQVENPTSSIPGLRVVRSVPLPAGANELAIIARPGRGNLVAVTCSEAGVLAIYDDESGNLVAQLPGVGLQPYGIAVDATRGAGARLYVSNFGDGRIAVVDIPDLQQPQNARLVAHLGARQTCLINQKDALCGGSN